MFEISRPMKKKTKTNSRFIEFFFLFSIKFTHSELDMPPKKDAKGGAKDKGKSGGNEDKSGE